MTDLKKMEERGQVREIQAGGARTVSDDRGSNWIQQYAGKENCLSSAINDRKVLPKLAKIPRRFLNNFPATRMTKLSKFVTLSLMIKAQIQSKVPKLPNCLAHSGDFSRNSIRTRSV